MLTKHYRDLDILEGWMESDPEPTRDACGIRCDDRTRLLSDHVCARRPVAPEWARRESDRARRELAADLRDGAILALIVCAILLRMVTL